METINAPMKGIQAEVTRILSKSINRTIFDEISANALFKILENQSPEKRKNAIKNFLIYLTEPLNSIFILEDLKYLELSNYVKKEEIQQFTDSYVSKFQDLQNFIDLAKKVNLNPSEIKEILTIKIQQSSKNPLEELPTYILKKGQVPAPLKEFFTYEEINQIWLNRNSQVSKINTHKIN